MHPDDLKDKLTHQVGPLPAWGWIAVAGGAFVVVKMLGGGTPNSSDTSVTEPDVNEPANPNMGPQGNPGPKGDKGDTGKRGPAGRMTFAQWLKWWRKYQKMHPKPPVKHQRPPKLTPRGGDHRDPHPFLAEANNSHPAITTRQAGSVTIAPPSITPGRVAVRPIRTDPVMGPPYGSGGSHPMLPNRPPTPPSRRPGRSPASVG